MQEKGVKRVLLSVDELLVIYGKAQEELKTKYYSFFKNLVVVSIAVLTVLVSYGSSNFDNSTFPAAAGDQVLLYKLSIGSLALGTLAALAILYGEINVLKNSLTDLREIINGHKTNDQRGISDVPRHPVFDLIEGACYFFYASFLILIAAIGAIL